MWKIHYKNWMKRSKFLVFFAVFSISLVTLLFYNSDNVVRRMIQRLLSPAATSEDSPWQHVPTLELVLRMNSNPLFVKLYKNWFLKSLKLFWPNDWLHLTLVLDDEKSMDHFVGKLCSKSWPRPKVVYLEPGDRSVYQANQRRRMYLDYFYPDNYVTANYVGFVDVDTMFTSVVTPQVLFSGPKPTVQARIGEPYWQEHWECWSDVTEKILGKKEALQCMSYFPVIAKVQHIIELREYVEELHKKPFKQVFNESIRIENPYFRGSKLNDCMCQVSIICNYLWYYHNDEYDFHLQMVPDDTWEDEARRESQVSSAYLKKIKPRFKLPKPRISIHARHYMEGGKYLSGSLIDTMRDPISSHLERRLQEGICFAIGFDRCPEKCYSFDKNELQMSLFSFERFEWFWDKRCIETQKKHYQDVKKLIQYNELNGKEMFGFHPLTKVCDGVF